MTTFIAARDGSFLSLFETSSEGSDEATGTPVATATAASSTTQPLAAWLEDINRSLASKGEVRESFVEIVDGSLALAFGAPSEAGDPVRALFVVSRGGRFSKRVMQWARDQGSEAETRHTTSRLEDGILHELQREGRRQPLLILTTESHLLLSGTREVVEAASKAHGSSHDKLSRTPLYRKALAAMSREAAVVAVTDPSLLRRTARDALSRKSGLVAAQPGTVLQFVESLGAQLLPGRPVTRVELLALVDTGSPIYPLLETSLPAEDPVAPGVVPAEVPFFMDVLLRLSEESELPRDSDEVLKKLRELKAARQALVSLIGLNWNLDIDPWVGNEVALAVLWDTRLPQVALMVRTRDEEAAAGAIRGVLSNFRGKVELLEDRLLSHPVTRLKILSMPSLHPLFATLKGFLVLASGPEIVEGLIDDRPRLADDTAFSTIYSTRGTRRLQVAAHMDPDLLRRVEQASPPARTAALKPLRESLEAVSFAGGLTHPGVYRATLVLRLE